MVEEKPDARDLEFTRGEIEFRNVNFGHKREIKPDDDDKKNDEELKDPAELMSNGNSNGEEYRYLFKNLNLKI